MSRHYSQLFAGTFSAGWTGSVSDNLSSVTKLEDAIVGADGYVYARGKLATKLTLAEPIEFTEFFRRKNAPALAAIATASNFYIYEVDSLDAFTQKLVLSRASNSPISAIMYQDDIFFTLDSTLRFYDPESDLSREAQLPIPLDPTLALEGEGNIRGTVSYRITHRRQDGTRQEVESPSSSAVSIDTFGSGVRLNWSTPPAGLGISHTRIYRAQVDSGIVRPYLLVSSVDVGTTTYLDTAELSTLGSAIYTIGETLPGADICGIWLDHLFVAFGDRVYISSPFRPETFEPGINFAMDEGAEPMGEIRRLQPAQDRFQVIKRDSVYEIISSGSPQVPWARQLVSSKFGSDSTLGSTELSQGQIAIVGPGELRINGRDVLGTLERTYLDLSAAARDNAALTFQTDDKLLLMCLTTELWAYTRQRWSKWKLQAKTASVLERAGTDTLFIGLADGTVAKHDRADRATAQVDATHIITVAGSRDAIARQMSLKARGVGSVACRLRATDTGMESDWTYTGINAVNESRTIPISVFVRGKTFVVEVVVSGRAGVSTYEVNGRVGRQVKNELGRK